jgi:hypothetical protein
LGMDVFRCQGFLCQVDWCHVFLCQVIRWLQELRYSFQEKDFGFVVTALAVPRWMAKAVTTNVYLNIYSLW